MTTKKPITPAQAYPHAMHLITELGEVIGDRDGISQVLGDHMSEHADWGHIAISALAYTFAEHSRLDPEWQPTTEGINQ